MDKFWNERMTCWKSWVEREEKKNAGSQTFSDQYHKHFTRVNYDSSKITSLSPYCLQATMHCVESVLVYNRKLRVYNVYEIDTCCPQVTATGLAHSLPPPPVHPLLPSPFFFQFFPLSFLLRSLLLSFIFPRSLFIPLPISLSLYLSISLSLYLSISLSLYLSISLSLYLIFSLPSLRSLFSSPSLLFGIYDLILFFISPLLPSPSLSMPLSPSFVLISSPSLSLPPSLFFSAALSQTATVSVTTCLRIRHWRNETRVSVTNQTTCRLAD